MIDRHESFGLAVLFVGMGWLLWRFVVALAFIAFASLVLARLVLRSVGHTLGLAEPAPWAASIGALWTLLGEA